ncbi:Outer membrane protein C [Candidatus Erwinia haradaeae]|uniref:Outer membrane protein C n=1 Tax=Candidatus Erwinia haradaeae TaxID=1922217 RepID=A0A451CYP7_9GAMM|nr:porin [Candidatus Erwinia haradaeae]VFP78473.1 Outer membrane protein C [Candidatus Erwinia haradaeae]
MMKNKIFAVVLPALLAAGAANAEEIYNKDGNKINLYGTINLGHQFSKNLNDDNDNSYLRFGFKGESQINDFLTSYGQWEYNIQTNLPETDATSGSQTRLGFAGVKFSNYGTIDYGRNYGVGYDPLSWTNILPSSGGNSAYSDNGMVGRSNDLVTYRNSNLFGLLDGLDIALQYQRKNNNNTHSHGIRTENGSGIGSSITYATPVGVAISAAYTHADRTKDQEAAYFSNGKKTAETWATAMKYDAHNVYVAAMYGETRNNTYIKTTTESTKHEGMVDKEQKFEAVAQYKSNCGLRPSLAYLQSIGKKISKLGKQDLYKYIDLATYYNFNSKLLTYVDYKINLLDKNDFTNKAQINTDDTVAVGLIYQF